MGYNGKILRINLSNRSIKTERIYDRFCRMYIGGAGFVTYYLWKELKPGIDALSADNKLIFALGPISGLQIPGADRNCVGAKSPLTGGIAKSEVGGYWASELKRAGYDAIIIEGKADIPVYIWVQDGEVSIRDARHLWGKETKETQIEIRNELGDNRIRLASIGPAGENMVLYACIMNGLHDAAGRGGLGAVMGSKKLKAIAVRGHKLPKIADSERLKAIRKQLSEPQWMSEYGTGGPEIMAMEREGNLPVRNFRDGIFPEVKQIHGGVIKDILMGSMEGCYACPVRCKKVVQFDEPYRVDAAYGGPEYETIAALGSNCGIGNIKAIVKGNERCGAYSLDTISTGVTIAFAMECFEKGLLTTKDTGGIDLKFGNDNAMLEVIDLISRRQGIGDLLADGTARLSRKLGRRTEEFAMHVKGLEAAMHEPRLRHAMGLQFMVGNNGADHTGSGEFFLNNELGINELHPLGIFETVPPEKLTPRLIAIFQLGQFKLTLMDSMVVCMITPYTFQILADVACAVTGWDTGIPEQLKVAQRIMTLARLFNIREGIIGADDMLPLRYYQPKTDGFLSDKPLDRTELEQAKNYYYTLMGWDDTGVPLPEKVEELYIE
jgi:aldehyde:ferredoxin oxidoreductase